MKKMIIGVLTVLTLAGCGITTTNEGQSKQQVSPPSQEEKVEQNVEIVVTKENGKEKITSSTIEFEEGQSLMDAMKKNFDLETAYEGTFITGINGEIADESKQYAWVYSINGEEAMVGASEYILKDGDVIQFDLHKW
jgi:Domain of unknown function (DUF4430)